MPNGCYRPIYEVWLDEPDYQSLTPQARLVFITLKVKLGVSGIDVLNAASHVVATLTGYSAEEVEGAFNELQAAGRIRFESNIYRIVGGLDAEPMFRVSHPKHRTSIQRHVDSLPQLPIVAEYRASHAPWFVSASDKGVDPESRNQNPFDSLGEGHPDAIPIRRNEKGEPSDEINPDSAGVTFHHDTQRNAKSHPRLFPTSRKVSRTFEVLKGEGYLVFGRIYAKRRTVQTPSGARHLIPKEELNTLNWAAKGALLAIGGAGALAAAEGERYGMMSGQFATAYAAAAGDEHSATA